jgi:hypothetical protein
MEPYVVTILSASIGAGVAIFTNFWRTRYTIRAQDFSKRVEELSASIKKLESLASERWSSGKDGATPSLVPLILGSQAQINLVITYLNDEYREFDKSTISEPLTSFFDACSGGAFDERAVLEPNRIRRILVDGERLRIELLKTRNNLY